MCDQARRKFRVFRKAAETGGPSLAFQPKAACEAGAKGPCCRTSCARQSAKIEIVKDVGFWHKADIEGLRLNVRFRG
jgi:hypothetical protein